MSSPLEVELRRRCPAVRFLGSRRLRKLLQALDDAGRRVVVNPQLPLSVDKKTLIEREMMEIEPDAPDTLLLMTPPEERGLAENDLQAYERLIYRTEIREIAQAEFAEQWQQFSPAESREIAAVLHSD